MRIIGLSGKMRSGKSTLAGLLQTHLRDVYRVSFGDEVRREVARGMGFPDEDWKFPFLTHDKNDMRPVLQAWGHNMRKIRGEGVWVHKLMTRIVSENQYNPKKIWVIDDIRYLNELEAIQNLSTESILDGDYKFSIIRLECNQDTQIRRGCSPEYLHHESEVMLDDFDFSQDKCSVIQSDNDDCEEMLLYTLYLLQGEGILTDYEVKDAITSFKYDMSW